MKRAGERNRATRHAPARTDRTGARGLALERGARYGRSDTSCGIPSSVAIGSVGSAGAAGAGYIPG